MNDLPNKDCKHPFETIIEDKGFYGFVQVFAIQSNFSMAESYYESLDSLNLDMFKDQSEKFNSDIKSIHNIQNEKGISGYDAFSEFYKGKYN